MRGVDDDGRWMGSGEAAGAYVTGRHGGRDLHTHLGLGSVSFAQYLYTITLHDICKYE